MDRRRGSRCVARRHMLCIRALHVWKCAHMHVGTCFPSVSARKEPHCSEMLIGQMRPSSRACLCSPALTSDH